MSDKKIPGCVKELKSIKRDDLMRMAKRLGAEKHFKTIEKKRKPKQSIATKRLTRDEICMAINMERRKKGNKWFLLLLGPAFVTLLFGAKAWQAARSKKGLEKVEDTNTIPEIGQKLLTSVTSRAPPAMVQALSRNEVRYDQTLIQYNKINEKIEKRKKEQRENEKLEKLLLQLATDRDKKETKQANKEAKQARKEAKALEEANKNNNMLIEMLREEREKEAKKKKALMNASVGNNADEDYQYRLLPPPKNITLPPPPPATATAPRVVKARQPPKLPPLHPPTNRKGSQGSSNRNKKTAHGEKDSLYPMRMQAQAQRQPNKK